jgi:uncharacterized RDD family membrane protein YckC
MPADLQNAQIPTSISRARLARIGDRVVAAILDGALLMPFLFLGISCVGVWFGLYDQGTTNLTGGPALIALGFFGFLGLTFYVIGEASFRGTFGKHIMGIEVLSSLRTPITLSQSLTRNLLRFIDGIGFYLVGFVVAVSSKQNQRIGDILAQTIVCEREDVRRGRALFWAGLFFACGMMVDALFVHFAGRFNNS